MLPDIPYKNGATKIPVGQFGGLERRIGAGNGTICDMRNLSGNNIPVLSSREKRYKLTDVTQPNGIWGNSYHLIYVDGETLYKDGTAFVSNLPSGLNATRHFAAMGNRLLIWPDKILVDIEGDGTKQNLEHDVGASCTFINGTLDGVTAPGNTIQAPNGFDWSDSFRVGDAVTISGAANAENNKTSIVREIDGRNLRFDVNCFTVNTTAKQIVVKREVPDLDGICVNDNRVWGFSGDTIWASKLGDPFNWYDFQGISTSSFSVETGTAGSINACISFMGYPCFFKEDRVFKVYGSRPSNFEVMGSATLGVMQYAAQSLAVAGETLYYLSRAGFVRYNGGYPSVIDQALDQKYVAAVAGSDGRKYYVSAIRNDNEECEFLVFDPDTGQWFLEDDTAYSGGFGYFNGYLCGMTDGDVQTVNGWPYMWVDPDDSGIEADFESGAAFADFDLQTFGSKYPVRLWLRYESENALQVKISYDGGTMESVTALAAGDKQTKYMPVPIRRCDRFRIRIDTIGAWKLYAMEIETRAQTTSRRGG